MGLEGFRLTLPNGDVFRAKSNIEDSHQQEYQFLFDGFRNALALYNQFDGNDGNANTQTVFLGSGAGIRRIDITFDQYEDSLEEWGKAAPGDDKTIKRDVLDQAIATTEITSTSPAVLEKGEFSTDGEFGPLNVVVQNSNLTVSYNEDQSVSAFNGTITFLDAGDLNDVKTAAGLTG